MKDPNKVAVKKVADAGALATWQQKALAEGVTGLIFGLFISLVIVVALALNLDFARSVEQQGIDWSMRLGLFFGIEPSNGTTAPAAPTRIVFLDVDVAACEELAESRSLCLTDRIARAEVLRPVGEALRHSQAGLIVLDFGAPIMGRVARTRGADALSAQRDTCSSPSAGDDAARQFLDVWACGEGPIVIAALSIAEAEGRALSVDWRYIPGGAPVVGRLRYATAVTWTRPIDGGRIRGYPLAVEVNRYVGNTPQASVLPSVPFAATLYAHHYAPQVDCVLFELPAGCRVRPIRWNDFRFDRLDQLSDLIERRTGPTEGWGQRFLFSFPSQVPKSPTAVETFGGSLLGQFEHRYLSAYVRDRQIEIPQEHLRGAIVIVGSSAATASDWHDTPLGYMTGAEIVGNAIHAFESYPLVAQPRLWVNFLVKALFVALAFLVSWLAWRKMERRRSQPTPSGSDFTRRLWRKSATLRTFLAATGVAIFLILLEGLVSLTFFPENGQTIDVLFPTLAVFAQAFVELAGWLLTGAKAAVMKALSNR